MTAKLALAVTFICVTGTMTVHSRADEPVKKMVITNEPLTVTILPSDVVKAAIAALGDKDSKTVLRLVVEDMVPPEDRAAVGGIRIFLNKSDATVKTPVNDIHFVTAIDFSPTAEREPMAFNVDISRASKTLQERKKFDTCKPLRITFVAVPNKGHDKLPKGFAVPIGNVAVEAVDVGK
jgi:hypothetical protein